MGKIDIKDFVSELKTKGEKSYVAFYNNTPEYDALMQLRKFGVRGQNVSKLIGQLIINFINEQKVK